MLFVGLILSVFSSSVLLHAVQGLPTSCYQCITCEHEGGDEIFPYLSDNLGKSAGVSSQLKTFDSLAEFKANFGNKECPHSMISEASNETLDSEGASCFTMAFNLYGTGPFEPFDSFLSCSVMGSLEDFYEDPEMAPTSSLTAANLYADLEAAAKDSLYVNDVITASIILCDDANNCNDEVPGFETYEVHWELDKSVSSSLRYDRFNDALEKYCDYLICPLLPSIVHDCEFLRVENVTIMEDGRNYNIRNINQFFAVKIMPLNPMPVSWVLERAQRAFDRLTVAHDRENKVNLNEYLVDAHLKGFSDHDPLLNIYKVTKIGTSNMPLMGH